MNPKTKQALITFSQAVADAISRAACCKDVDWREVVAANRELEHALRLEPDTPQLIARRHPRMSKSSINTANANSITA